MNKDEKTAGLPPQDGMQGNIENGLRWAAVRQGILFFVGTAGILTYTRALGPEGIGLFVIANFVYALLSAIAQAPFRDAVIYFREEKHTHATFACLAGLGLAGVAIAFVAAPWISVYYESEGATILIRAMLVVFLLASGAIVPAALLLKTFQFRAHELLKSAAEIVFTLVVVCFVWMGWDVWALFLGHLCQNAFWMIMTWWFSGYRPRWTSDWQAYKDVLRYSGNLMGSEMLGYINNNADNAAAGGFGEVKLGLYTFGENQSSFLVLGIGLPISQIALPALAAVRESAKEFRKVLGDMMRLVSVISTPGHVGAFLLADYITVLFFGTEWLEALWILRAYFGYRIFLTILAIPNSAASAYGRTDIRFKQDLIQVPLFLAGIWVSLEYWGTVEAMAWILVGVRNFMAFIHMAWIVHATPMTWRAVWQSLWPSFLSSAVLGGIIVAARGFDVFGFAPPTDFWTALVPIAVYVPLGILGYVGLYFVVDRAGFWEVVMLGKRVIRPEKEGEK